MESQKTRQPDQKERKRDVMYNPKSLKAEEFISDEEIRETLAYADANKDNIELIDQILAKAKECKGLTHREASVLLACEMPEKIQEMYEHAAEIKKEFTETGSCFLHRCICPITVSTAVYTVRIIKRIHISPGKN